MNRPLAALAVAAVLPLSACAGTANAAQDSPAASHTRSAASAPASTTPSAPGPSSNVASATPARIEVRDTVGDTGGTFSKTPNMATGAPLSASTMNAVRATADVTTATYQVKRNTIGGPGRSMLRIDITTARHLRAGSRVSYVTRFRSGGHEFKVVCALPTTLSVYVQRHGHWAEVRDLTSEGLEGRDRKIEAVIVAPMGRSFTGFQTTVVTRFRGDYVGRLRDVVTAQPNVLRLP